MSKIRKINSYVNFYIIKLSDIFFCCQIVLFKQLKTFYRDEKLERKAKFYFFCKKRKPALLVICYLKTSRWGKQ